jgi:peptidyl-prolyl cis-trans isomerase D
VKNNKNIFLLNTLRGGNMKRVLKLILFVLIVGAFMFSGFSCKKKESPKFGTKIEQPPLSPEQKRQLEEIKKGIEESKKLVVAKVNGQPITMFQIVREMNSIAPKYIKEGEPSTPEITEKIKKEALKTLIDKELAIQEAKRQKITIKKETIDNVIDKLIDMLGSKKAFEQDLKERNLTEYELRKNIERSHLYELITKKEIYDKIVVNDEVLKNYYEKNKKLFVLPSKPPKQMGFEEAKDLVKKYYKADEGRRLMDIWLEGLRKNAKIEIIDEEFKRLASS